MICMLILLSGCGKAAEEKPTDPFADNYIGDGQMTVIRSLINTNALLVEEVFIEKALENDAGNAISTDKGKYSPVTSKQITSYSQLLETLDATYTKETVEKILADYDKYIDISGKFYVKTDFAPKGENLDWSNPQITVEKAVDGTYELEVEIKDAGGNNKKFNVKAVTVDGNIRLENMYY